MKKNHAKQTLYFIIDICMKYKKLLISLNKVINKTYSFMEIKTATAISYNSYFGVYIFSASDILLYR